MWTVRGPEKEQGETIEQLSDAVIAAFQKTKPELPPGLFGESQEMISFELNQTLSNNFTMQCDFREIKSESHGVYSLQRATKLLFILAVGQSTRNANYIIKV